MRNELTAIDRISNRIATIAGTSFIPTAYAISEVAIGAVIVVLLFLKMDSLLQGLVLFGAIAVLSIGLLLLIKDMDNPFEVGAGTYADVNLDLLWHLQEEMRAEQGGGTRSS
jgi:sugar phosphate permease